MLITFSFLLGTCILIPVLIAFKRIRKFYIWNAIDILINAVFAINILITFFVAYYDQEYLLVTNRKVSPHID